MSSYAAGGLRSTVLDLAKWDAALYTDKILKHSTLDLMWSPTTLNDGLPSNYGFGWMIGDKNSHRFVRHSGNRESGFDASICRYRDDKLTIIVLTNLFRGNPTTLSEGIAGIIDSSLA
jgi:CubicO group peptidase (beta-lactamase class C family)